MQKQAHDDADLVEPLISILRDCYTVDTRTSEMNNAVIALSDDLIRLGEPAVEPLLQALSDPALRFFAICTLGHLGDNRATEPLLNLLAKESAEGGEDLLYLITALGRIGDARSVTALTELLAAAEHHAFKAPPQPSVLHSDLGEVINAWLYRRQSALARTEHEQYLRRQLPLCLIQALGRIGDSRAVAAIQARLTDADEVIVSAAQRALSQLDKGVNGDIVF